MLKLKPLPNERRHRADYRDEIEHLEVVKILSELPADRIAIYALDLVERLTDAHMAHQEESGQVRQVRLGSRLFPVASRRMFKVRSVLLMLCVAGAAQAAEISVSTPTGPLLVLDDFRIVEPYSIATVGSTITLTATATVSPLSQPIYRFTAVRRVKKKTFHIANSTASQVVWIPPEPGDYVFRVVVTSGHHKSSASRGPFHIRVPTVPTINLSANPPVKGLSGTFELRAQISLPATALLSGGGMGVVHRIEAGYLKKSSDSQEKRTWSLPMLAKGSTLSWRPVLQPGLYDVTIYVKSYRNGELIAEGKATSGNPNESLSPDGSFYRGRYVVLITPGECPAAMATSRPEQPFGWNTPITLKNAFLTPTAVLPTPAVGDPLGNADCAIAGYSIHTIANNPNARVRGLNVACTNCHQGQMFGDEGRDWLCDRIAAGDFAKYHNTGNPPDQETTLNGLLTHWERKDCPR